jgi:hypothetical protein
VNSFPFPARVFTGLWLEQMFQEYNRPKCTFGNVLKTTDKRTDVWSRPSCIYTKNFSPKKTGFLPIKNTSQIFFEFCLPLFYATFQCGPWKIFKKKLNQFFVNQNFKNGHQKLLIIGTNPFISQSSPDHSPQPRIDFSYCEISGPDICSLICVKDTIDRNCK